MSDRNTLLIIEDNLADYANYMRLLDDEKAIFASVEHVQTLTDAHHYLEENLPQCCILDFNLPGGSAKDFIQGLYKTYGELRFPIVVSTGQGDERLAVELMQMGVQDYLVKDHLTGSELSRAIKNAVRTFSLQKQLRQMAHYDSLTGLLNRSLFMDRLEQAVNEAKRYERNLCLICLDIDHFKQINDTYGHDVGDIILKTVADRIKECVRETDSVARLGGDEYVVMLPNAASHDGHFVSQKLLQHIPSPVKLDENILYIYPSIGLANFSESVSDYRELLKQADAALYIAKEQGRSQYVRFTETYRCLWQRKNRLSKALPIAVTNGELALEYQPVFDIHSGEALGVEALVRWDFDGEQISAENIVDLIHQGSMAIPYHEWLFSETLSQLKTWQQDRPDLHLAINMPADLCHNNIIIERLFSAIEENEIESSSIVLEITETHLMRHPELTREVLLGISKQGVLIAIDDFGTGYSSMEYLAGLPCSQLKIDQRFFLNWDMNEKNQKIVEAITVLGHQLGLEVIAEGIESQYLCDVVKSIGCDGAQGFWLGTPQAGMQSWGEYLNQSVAQSH